MKKCLLVLITLVVLSVGSASAQAVWGVRIGLSRPTVSTSGGDEGSAKIDGKFGLELGPVLYYNLKNNFYINSGLMFSIKTFSDKYDDGEYSYSDNLNMYYLHIPVYVGYQIPIGKVSTYLQAGPYFGYMLSASENYSDSENGSADGSPKDYLNSFDAGLGVMYGINIDRFKIEVGYQYGLTNLLKNSGDYAGSGTANLSSLFLGVSYVF